MIQERPAIQKRSIPLYKQMEMRHQALLMAEEEEKSKTRVRERTEQRINEKIRGKKRQDETREPFFIMGGDFDIERGGGGAMEIETATRKSLEKLEKHSRSNQFP